MNKRFCSYVLILVFSFIFNINYINAAEKYPDASEISYATTSNSSVTNVKQALDDLYNVLGNDSNNLNLKKPNNDDGLGTMNHSKDIIENPNTGKFIVNTLVLLILCSIVVFKNISNTKRIFKL